MPKAKTVSNKEIANELPKQGGSYSRDPVSGKLTLNQQTKPALAKVADEKAPVKEGK